jgi:hypothetical protein
MEASGSNEVWRNPARMRAGLRARDLDRIDAKRLRTRANAIASKHALPALEQAGHLEIQPYVTS